MSDIELTEAFFARIAGWEAMKQARAVVREKRVLSADWSPPVLKGVVQSGSAAFRCGFVIRSERDIENLCSCRMSRSTGAMCAHSVAVGLKWVLEPAEEATKKIEPSNSQSLAQEPVPESSEDSAALKPRVALWQRAAPGESGEPVAIHVILPPNLEQSAARGKVMICLEAEYHGLRKPLAVLTRSETLYVSPQDEALLDWVETGGNPPAMFMLDAGGVATVFPLLVDHPRVTLGKSTPVRVRAEPWTPPVVARLEEDGSLSLKLKTKVKPPLLLPGGWVLHEHILKPFGLPASCLGLFQAPVQISRPQLPDFLVQDWPVWARAATTESEFDLSEFILERKNPEIHLHLTGGLAILEARLKVVYGHETLETDTMGRVTAESPQWMPDPSHKTRYFGRNLHGENEAVNRLARNGFVRQKQGGHWKLTGRESVLDFLARDYVVMSRQWKVTMEERLEKSTEKNLEWIEPRFQVRSSSEQWFEMNLAYQSGEGTPMTASEIQSLLRSGHRHAARKGGKIALVDTEAVEELQQVLSECSARQDSNGYRMPLWQAGYLEGSVRAQGWSVHAPSDWGQLAGEANRQTHPVCPPLGSLESVLRPYQKEGVAWIFFLRNHGFGGVLADEMGLGKTLQTLAYLKTHHLSSSPPSHPSLVVCPTSLVSNWAAEAQRFTPELKVAVWHGPDRHQQKPSHLAGQHLIVTSYALIKRDMSVFKGFTLDTIILDEAQHIKNRKTQNAQAVKDLSARHRLALTGTPLENSVQDLWSLFDFLMPGYLGPAAEFKERYEIPLSHDPNGPTQARLARRVRPFLLRRTKKEVVPDLPDKLEQVAFCDLNRDQQSLYGQLLQASRREIMASAGAGDQGPNRMLVLNALLRLRQVCCDPRLLPGHQPSSRSASVSAKLDLFGELLEEALDGGHRILVFSQFVRMLGLLREFLDDRKMDYCYLDGSTRDRASEVQRFQRTGRIPVFLISLKAGGVGLNLTGADTVIHFDPWWNPMVEAQATDRAHRIGQEKVVTSYKLIARGTVEEKILKLQERKKAAIKATLGDEDSLTSALSWEDLQELFTDSELQGGAGL